jgi:hypothetical protein
MATRLAEPEPWCRVAAVLAEAAGVDESRSFDAAALAQAKRMRGIRYDWAGRPTCTWSAAAELLDSLRAEAAGRRAAIEERLVEADRAFRATMPPGLPVSAEVPGLSAGMLMMLSDEEAQSARRESPVEHALRNSGSAVYHPIRGERAAQ